MNEDYFKWDFTGTIGKRIGFCLPPAKANSMKIDEATMVQIPMRRIGKRYQIYNGKRWVKFYHRVAY